MIGRYKKKEIDFYYDNALISYSYGEFNIEKCIIIITIILILSITFLFIYFPIFSLMKTFLMLLTISLDTIILTFYSYVIYNLKKNEIFQRVSLRSYQIIEIVIFINYLTKLILGFATFFDNKFYIFWCLFFLIIKMILDTYFSILSLKIFMHSNCMINAREFFERLATTIKYYILCC